MKRLLHGDLSWCACFTLVHCLGGYLFTSYFGASFWGKRSATVHFVKPLFFSTLFNVLFFRCFICLAWSML